MKKYYILFAAVFFTATTQAQNVGIGTTNPTEKLHVNGNIRVADDADIFGLDQLVGLNDLRLYGDNSTIGALSDLFVGPNGDVLIQNGNLGIGLAGPTDKLHVNGDIRVADDRDIFGLDILQGFNDLRFSGDATGGPDFIIQASGLSGIGGISPNVALDVNNFSSNSSGAIFVATNASGSDKFQIWDNGDVFAIGDFTVSGGTKNFMLDHPLDPANKDLYHNAVESPDHVTYYHGTVTLDASGSASVDLPDYFEALNKDFHYQLTCIGGFAQVYVSDEIADNEFSIAGGTPGLKVSWQVSATRNDPWAQDHPYEAEVDKKPSHKGKYWYPKGYGKSKEYQIGYNAKKDGMNQ